MQRLLVVIFLLLWVETPAAAEEVIRNFISNITVQRDGTLDVQEAITVRAEGNTIKRGILREFPTTYTDKNGVRVRVGFDVLNVERNGRDETYALESIANGIRIRIGNKDVLLNTGDHTYKITYRTTRQVGFFESFDELYWNVTGNGWTFPIEEAAAILRLPDGATIKQHAIYTGYAGANGADAKVEQASGSRFQARTTRRLEPLEGFTIAVGFQKGVVAPPTEADKRHDWIMDNLGYIVLAMTLLLVPVYYLWAWTRVGRDPPKGTIVPLFRPPEGMGASAVRYVWKDGYDDKAFAAALVGLAVKGRMAIRNDNDEYIITKSENGTQSLSRSEQALWGATPGASLRLAQANHASVRHMRAALQGALDDEYDGVMYLKNFKWFFVGLLLSALGLVGAALLMPAQDGGLILGIGGFTTIWWGVILAVGYSVVKGVFAAGGWFSKIRSLMGLVFLVPFVGAGVMVPTIAYLTDSVTGAAKWFLMGAVALVACNFIFYWLLKAPTPKGRGVLDQLEGFRLYMTTAEEKRLNMLHPPQKTPQLFERYLPYAMALDCENEWNAKFAAVLAAAAATGAAAGAVGGWYHGTGGFSTRDFGSDLGKSLSAAIASSGVAPGTSSGSGGGGFSGGGGGGGGGSGW